MTSVLSILPIVVRRFAANARLLAAVLIGAVLAAALLSTTSIYTGAIRDLGLTFALRESGPINNDISVRSSSQTSENDVYLTSRQFIGDTAESTIGDLIVGTNFMGRSATFFPAPPGERFREDTGRPRAHIQFLSQLDEHIRVVEGRMPESAAAGDGSAPSVEVAVGAETAQRIGIAIGDSFDLFAFWDLDVAPIRVTVVGVIEPIDPDELYWRGIDTIFSYFASGWETMPFFVTEETFFGAIGGYLPAMSSTYWSFFHLDTSNIDARNSEHVRGSLETFNREMNTKLTRTTLKTALPNVLETFDEKLFFTRIPLLVLVLQIAGIVLYYLFMVSTMLVERQSGEIALLKSRGATTPQVMQIYLIEGLFVFVAALGLGPPLAALVISLLGHTPAFQDLSGGASLNVQLSVGAYLWAAAGALLAYTTLLLPAYFASRRTVVQQRASAARPPKAAAFTRYYLDVALVILGAILLYQLDRSGTLSTDRLFGGQSVDPIRLLTPAFFILTVGLVFLRIFPLVLKLVAWIVARSQGTAILIGMWHLVRNPVHYSRLVLLLMLATAVGTFAASFGATLDRSYGDRAAYQAGAGLRLSSIRQADSAGPDSLVEDIQQITGASAGTSVLRTGGFPAPVGNALVSSSFELLGVDGEEIAAIGLYRDDFAGESITSLLAMTEMEAPSSASILLPPDSHWLGIWINPVDLRGRAGIVVELKDAAGRYFSYVLGPRFGNNMPQGWHFLVVDLTDPPTSQGSVQFGPDLPTAPLSVQSISIRFNSRFSASSGVLLLDDLQTSTDLTLPGSLANDKIIFDPARELEIFAQSQVIVSFDSVDDWQTIQGITSQALPDELRTISTDDSGTVTELTWRPSGRGAMTHGLRPRIEHPPLLILASQAFLDETNTFIGETLNVGSGNSYFDVTIVGSFDLFPTLDDPRREPAIIADRESLLAVLNANPTGSAIYADEVWLTPAEGSFEKVNEAILAGRIRAEVISVEQLREAQEKDPLVAAGWEGILFISFAAILLLSVIGFLIYSYLTAQQRTVEFAVLRTVGFSKKQVAVVVGFEQALVISLGMAAGTLMGLRLGTLMIRYMGVTETGDDVVPPMLLQVSWSTIGTAWITLGAAFLVTIGIVVLLYSRLALHRVLRIGE